MSRKNRIDGTSKARENKIIPSNRYSMAKLDTNAVLENNHSDNDGESGAYSK